MAEQRRVGYIGLGLMGSGMARNLMRAGYPVVVHNRSRAIVDQLVSEGAVAAASPREVAEHADVVFTNLPDSPDVERVALGPDGVIAGARAGMVFVDNSTIKPETARHIAAAFAEKGVLSLDAPVSGGQIGAVQGTLVFMVGGPYEAFEQVTPLFKAMGKQWTYVGESGAGQIAKAANQIMTAAQMVALGELLVFAQKCGVDPFKVASAIQGGAAQCWALDVKPPRLAKGNRAPQFKAFMHLKDLRIILETGQTYGAPTPLSALMEQRFQKMVDSGRGDLDNGAVLAVWEDEANVQVGPQTPEA